VFASRLKQRMRQGAKLIVIDPRTIGLVRAPHIEADYHLQLRPGTNVAVINALAHVIVTDGLTRESYVGERCEPDSYRKWKAFIAEPRNSPEAAESITGVPAAIVRGPPGCTRPRRTARSTTDSASPSTAGDDDGDGDREPGDGNRKPGTRRCRGQSVARAEQRAGVVRPWIVPARVLRVPSRVGSGGARRVRVDLGRALEGRAWAAHPNMFDAALDGSFKGVYVQARTSRSRTRIPIT